MVFFATSPVTGLVAVIVYVPIFRFISILAIPLGAVLNVYDFEPILKVTDVFPNAFPLQSLSTVFRSHTT